MEMETIEMPEEIIRLNLKSLIELVLAREFHALTGEEFVQASLAFDSIDYYELADIYARGVNALAKALSISETYRCQPVELAELAVANHREEAA